METGISRSRARRFWRIDMEKESTRQVVELLLANGTERQAEVERTTTARTGGLLMGVLAGISAQGQGLVAFDTHSVDTPVIGRTIVPLTSQDVG